MPTVIKAWTPTDGPSMGVLQALHLISTFYFFAVCLQAIGWALFAVTLVVLIALAKQLIAGVGYCLRCWAVATGVLMCVTQVRGETPQGLGCSSSTFWNVCAPIHT